MRGGAGEPLPRHPAGRRPLCRHGLGGRGPISASPPRPQSEPSNSKPAEPKLSAEDREVVENLELLESMDTAEDLDLLLELSQDEEK